MNRKRKGPWAHQLFVWIFSFIFGVLIYWLLGFIVADIGSLQGPDYAAIESRLMDPALLQRQRDLAAELAQVKRSIEAQQQRQKILRDSTANSQTTMNQLLELQRLNLEKNVTPSVEERQALADSEQLFLQNQRQYQALNQNISDLNEQLEDLQESTRLNEAELAQARLPVQAEFQQQWERHRFWIGLYKLAFLIPLLLIAVMLYLKFGSGTYWAMIFAFGIATLVKVGFVMHDYFPERYFKYILIGTTLAVSARILYRLLRLVAHPSRDWLIKQNREAYEAFLCPVCRHPIRRGPLTFMSWSRRSIRKLSAKITDAGRSSEPYTCPACATQLYKECKQCGKVRHALLPACEHCGNVVDIPAADDDA